MSNAQAQAAPTMKKSAPWLFFFTMLFQIAGGTIAGQYLTFYMTSRMLITATVMGAVLMTTRIADLIVGILSGVVVQRVQFKPGQYRFWLFWGPLTVSIGTTMMFINPSIFPMWAKIMLVWVGYLLYGSGMSFIQLSQNGTVAKFAGASMENRIALTSRLAQGQRTGTIITAAITMPLVLNFDRFGVDGYKIMQYIYATIGFFGQLILYFGAKEIDVYNPNFKAQTGGPGIGHMIFSTLKNPQLIVLLVCDIMRMGSAMILMSMAMYYFSDIIHVPMMMATSLTIQSFLGWGCSFIAPTIAKRIGKKNSAIVSGLTAITGYLGMALLSMRGPVYYIVTNSFAIAGSTLIGAVGVNLYLDCGEYQLYTSGIDNRTFVMSIFGVSIKFSFIVTSFVSAVILNLAGYNAHMADPIADPHRFILFLGGIPAALQLLYTLGMGFFYKLTEEKAKEYAAINHERAQQNRATT